MTNAHVQLVRGVPNDKRPVWLLKPAVVRAILAILAVAALLFVVYASLVPMQYTPLPLDQTIDQFKQVPWLKLSIERRADWVANGLIMIPAAFFAAGAVDWQRRHRLALHLATPFILAVLIATVIGIEFVQIWFPPRVVSQNDMFAGILGSLSGVALWWLAGRFLLNQLMQFLSLDPGIHRWTILMSFTAVGICIYNLMPLDLLFSWEEYQMKANRGGFVWLPFSDIDGSKKAWLLAAAAAMRVVPYSFFQTLYAGSSIAFRRGCGWAFRCVA